MAETATAKPIIVRTSDSILFRRCRRKWMFQSHNKMYLEPDAEAIPALWFGTGWHFALEDYHGYNRFGHPYEAFKAYVRCFRKSQAPENYMELMDLAESMFAYYVDSWLPRHNEFQTYWMPKDPNDPNSELVPQLEVEFRVPIPGIDPNEAEYGGTFDRIVIDSYKRLWVLDYKTAAKIDTLKLDTDPQVGAYIWAAKQLYGPSIEGVIYIQFLKQKEKPPQELKNGGLSQNRQVACTHYAYKKALVEKYGFVPTEYVDFLNYLASKEGPDGDMYILRSIVRRSEEQTYNEGMKISQQSMEMVDTNIALYPNPTNMCATDCRFKNPCISMDAAEDWEYLIANGYKKRTELHHWRPLVAWPQPMLLDQLELSENSEQAS